MSSSSNIGIPVVPIGPDSRPMPLIGFGTGTYPLEPSEAMRSSIKQAIEIGYRHFDTAAIYQSEQPLGEAIAVALRSGLLGSRDEVFITSKLWCSDAHPGLVRPALQRTLQNLGLDYLDLYLIHWPVSYSPGKHEVPILKENLRPIDIDAVWEEMEECQRLGLTKSIGVSNFSCKKLEMLLSKAKVPPAVNQVEVNPLWQQKKLREFCTSKGIQLCAYSPLGASGVAWGTDMVMGCEVLKEIAAAKGKTVAQICLRWVFEQGDCLLVKSFNENRMKENLDILDWELNEEERQNISQIPQRKTVLGLEFVADDGPYKSSQEFWDEV